MFTPNLKNPGSTPATRPHTSAGSAAEQAEASAADHAALIREAQLGNSAAFEELVRYYNRTVLRLALHLTGSEYDAQDACQEALLSAYQNLASFRFECSFYTWMYRIVTNRCFDALRRRQSAQENVSSMGSLAGAENEALERVADCRPANNPELNLATCELRACITRALEKLTPRERLVFELKHYQDLKLRAVALMLNTSEGSARHTLFRATQKLRSALAGVR
jgi:RNA polymerase sigma-70 factor, ECF subfamily